VHGFLEILLVSRYQRELDALSDHAGDHDVREEGDGLMKQFAVPLKNLLRRS
jgi:hypothetical protein